MVLEQFFAFGFEGSMGFILPFFLMFAIVFGALDFVKMFDSKKVPLLISVVFGLFAVGFEPVRLLLVTYMPFAALLFVVFFFIGFLKKLFTGEKEKKVDYNLLGLIALLLFLFLTTQGELLSLLPFELMGDTLIIAGIVLIVLFFYAAYKHNKGG